MTTQSVLLPKNIISQKLNREMLNYYNCLIVNYQNDLYDNNEGKEYIIQDGPPYANGYLHIGHLLNKTLKDVLVKYKLTKGFKTRISFSWDCHGLPIENKAKGMEGNLEDNAKDIALFYSNKQKEILYDFGIYPTEDNFLTMEEDYKEREISLYNELKQNGYIYKKNKPTWYSPTLNTVLANSEIEYKKVNDESVYFKLKLNDCWLLVWTTTEWTIPGNQAICINKDINYVLTNNNLICSESFAKDNNFEYISFDLSKCSEYLNHNNENCPILFDDYVSDDKTGIVHLCGGHGDDDFRILVENNIEPKNVCEKELLLNHIDSYKLSEEFLYKREEYFHDYPIDWRESNKVYKVLTEQTYLDFDLNKIKNCLKEIKLSSKDRTRLSSTIFSRKDWCISRQRKWGVKIPDSDDILDVWFDSGSMFTYYETPADIYIEGSDQHRGWFQSSIILASMIDEVPTKRIFSHGFVLDETGEKFSKSKIKGNFLEELYEIYNPDVLRLWVILSDYKNDVIFSENSLQNSSKQYFKIRNMLRYLLNNLHRNVHSFDNINDIIFHSINKLKIDIDNNIETSLDYSKSMRQIIDWLSKYSSSLTEDIKNKFYTSNIDDEFRINLENEFKYILTEMVDIIYPFLSFLSIELKETI